MTVRLWFSNGRWTETKCKRNADAISDALNSILKPLLLLDTFTTLQLSNRLQATKIDNLSINKVDGTGLGKISMDMKQDLIDRLEENLKILKES